MSPYRRLIPSEATLSLMAGAGIVLALAAVAGRVGADARWLAALGHAVVTRGGIPSGVPFAAQASVHWPNVPVLAELIFYWLEQGLGDQGLMLAQLVAVAVALTVLIRDARSGGAEAPSAALALFLGGLGSVAALAIARAQLFSLALFPVLAWLLRSESRQPSRRIWLVVPLLALWSNLHGVALLGLAVLLAYLAFSRLREHPVLACAVGAAGAAAMCATPALLHTLSYYHGVLTGRAATSGQGMWASLSLGSPLDVLFMACALVLLVQFFRVRPALWERVVVAGLAVLSVQSSRNGLWLMLFLVPTAARAFAPQRQWRGLVAPAGLAAIAAVVFAIARGPLPDGAGGSLLARAVSLAHGSPVLAAGQIEEQVALAGGSIVAGDPIDAFPLRTQTAYLNWLAGKQSGLRGLETGVRVVLVMRGSRAQRLMTRAPGFTRAGGDSRTLLYLHRS